MASFRLSLFGALLFFAGLILYAIYGFITVDAVVLMLGGIGVFLLGAFLRFTTRHPWASAALVVLVVVATYLLLTAPIYVQPASPQNPSPQPGPAPCIVICLPGSPAVGFPPVPPVPPVPPMPMIVRATATVLS